ncbi:MAG TPA: hypothetical protein VNE62_07205 [Actinomycetota bacterium]|nr:hypothetical protein [Actinomycetota bacterium]
MTGTRPRRDTSAPSAGRRPGPVLAAVRPIAESIAGELGLVLWDVEFRREAGRDLLRVALDRTGRIDDAGLSSFAEAFSRALDESDPVPGSGRYLLEVTSPGAERPLRDAEQFRVCEGRPVRVTFKDGRPPLEGTIGPVDEQGAVVLSGTESVRVAFEEMSQARLRIPGA